MKIPQLGISDFGYYDSPNSDISLIDWMKEITARVNRLEMDLHGRHIPKHEISLSAQQKEVYLFVVESINTRGKSPTLQEIADRFSYKGISSSQRMVETLIRKKLLERKGHKLVPHPEVKKEEQ